MQRGGRRTWLLSARRRCSGAGGDPGVCVGVDAGAGAGTGVGPSQLHDHARVQLQIQVHSPGVREAVKHRG